MTDSAVRDERKYADDTLTDESRRVVAVTGEANLDVTEATVVSGAVWNAMAADVGWIAGHTSCLDITIMSILFLVVFIAFYTLCTSCFRKTPEEKVQNSPGPEKPSHLSLSVNVDHPRTQRSMNSVHVVSDVPQVRAGPQDESYAIVYSQQTNVYSHNRAKSDSYFSPQMMPRIQDTPVGSTDSMSSGPPALPPIPPIFYWTTGQVEQRKGQQLKTVKPVWDSVTPPPEDQPNMNSGLNETVSEEHPYACIDNMSVSEPSSPSPGNEADEDRWENESPYHTVTEWTEPPTTCDTDTFLPVIDSVKAEELEFPAVQDDQLFMDADRTAIYAAVNRNSKSQKSIEEAPAVQDTVVPDEDEAPPVPEKTFDSHIGLDNIC